MLDLVLTPVGPSAWRGTDCLHVTKGFWTPAGQAHLRISWMWSLPKRVFNHLTHCVEDVLRSFQLLGCKGFDLWGCQLCCDICFAAWWRIYLIFVPFLWSYFFQPNLFVSPSPLWNILYCMYNTWLDRLSHSPLVLSFVLSSPAGVEAAKWTLYGRQCQTDGG